jgi:hypothetical protein
MSKPLSMVDLMVLVSVLLSALILVETRFGGEVARPDKFEWSDGLVPPNLSAIDIDVVTR